MRLQQESSHLDIRFGNSVVSVCPTLTNFLHPVLDEDAQRLTDELTNVLGLQVAPPTQCTNF
jgi:hypothetical protein